MNNKNKQNYSSGNLQRNEKENKSRLSLSLFYYNDRKKEDFSHTTAIVSTFKDRKSWRRENRLGLSCSFELISLIYLETPPYPNFPLTCDLHKVKGLKRASRRFHKLIQIN